MLVDNSFVRCLMLDFSKAFDMVNHAILLSKLSSLNIPDFAVNWICSFLTDRRQVCKINGNYSKPASINLSIVQGSGLGPTLYIVMKTDLRTLSVNNRLFKFADDTTLLVPEHSDISLETEFDHIKLWASDNHLNLNLNKTKEIVLHRPRVMSFHLPPAVEGLDRVVTAKLLGVFIQSDFKMDLHVQNLLSQCSQRMYLLKLLRSQGMCAKLLINFILLLTVS